MKQRIIPVKYMPYPESGGEIIVEGNLENMPNTEALIDVSQYTEARTLSIDNLDGYDKIRLIGMSDTIDYILIYRAPNLVFEGNLPSNLVSFTCESCRLTSLPELPDSLAWLSVRHNMLEELPELPEDLDELWCGANLLRELPELPESLTLLSCNENLLESLPELPNSLVTLECAMNNLTKLPCLLGTGLETLICQNNKLTTIPRIPITLLKFDCSINADLSYLPLLPNMEYVIYNNTRLYNFMRNFVPFDLLETQLNGEYDLRMEEKIANLNTYYKFVYLYYTLKYKSKFIKWLWKSREKKIQEQYSPEKLKELLETNEGEDLSEILEKWE